MRRAAAWWNSIDRTFFCLVMGMFCVGTLVQASLFLDAPDTLLKIMVSIGLALAVLVITSTLSPAIIHSIAALALFVAVLLLFAVVFYGVTIHGSQRWLEIGNFRFQPSELVKAALCVVFAKRIDQQYSGHGIEAFVVTTVLFLLCTLLILIQPDISNVVIITLVFMLQWALAVTTRAILVPGAIIGTVAFIILYLSFPHVADRINSFLNPESLPAWQVAAGINALVEGGYQGKGIGLGWTEYGLSSVTNDFVYAAVGEQFGLVFAAILVLLIAAVIWRGMGLVFETADIFPVLAVAGLMLSFGVQSFFNIASTLHLLPTDGNNLPLISSGRSSLFTTAWAMGMVLALTRTRPVATRRASTVQPMQEFANWGDDAAAAAVPGHSPLADETFDPVANHLRISPAHHQNGDTPPSPPISN